MILRRNIEPLDNVRLARLCGPLDGHLRAIEAALGVQVRRREGHFSIEGGRRETALAWGVIEALHDRSERALPASLLDQLLQDAVNDLPSARSQASVGQAAPASKQAASARELVLHTRRVGLQARTPNQRTYLRNILSHDITFGIGPAGTGKTYLAVACAVDALERSQVQRIVLTRPAVEAGERLGFLPGDLTQKVDPYLRPLYDALYDLMGFDRVAKAFERGELEIAPLAFMRGRTLNDAFVILDEAQNTTPEQMKMFLTRIGLGAKAVVTGDTSQIDLPKSARSGLLDAERVLSRVKGIAMTHFTSADVVRHPLVARIVRAYARAADPPSASGEPTDQQA